MSKPFSRALVAKLCLKTWKFTSRILAIVNSFLNLRCMTRGSMGFPLNVSKYESVLSFMCSWRSSTKKLGKGMSRCDVSLLGARQTTLVLLSLAEFLIRCTVRCTCIIRRSKSISDQSNPQSSPILIPK
jgi:hypothetical protein